MTVPVPFYFGDPGDALFGWYHPPAGDRSRDCGVVLCNPIGDDYVRAHRTLRHLSEELAAAGFAVLRFDFHGTGDSSGDERDAENVRTWLADIDRAVAELRARSGAREVALVGLRMGATLAAIAAARSGGVSSVVLWGAYATGALFVTDATRTHKMHKMLEPESFAAGPARYPDGEEALGFFLSTETIAELGALDLRALDRSPAVRALVIDVANSRADQWLVDHLKSLGSDTAYRHLPGHKFLISIPHRSAVPTEVIDSIVTWLGAHHAASGRAATSEAEVPPSPGRVVQHARDGRDAAIEEAPVVFGGSRRLFGILAKPPGLAPPGAGRADRPCVIMMNAGCVHRIGPHRLFVRMARRWAERGLYVLRMDLSGIGDSPAAAGCEENLCYPKGGLEDCQEAMTFLRGEMGASRFILTGLCSGADLAFQLGFRDPRVAGVVMMNPRTFCVHDLSMVEAYKGARYYQESFFRKESWKKLLRGDVDAKRVVRMLAPKVKNEAVRRVKRLLERVRSDAPTTETVEARTDVPGCLRIMAERGVDTFLVATVKDPGVDYVDVNYGKSMRGLSDLSNFRRVDLEGTDHTFTSVYSQDHVASMVTDHLVRHHLA